MRVKKNCIVLAAFGVILMAGQQADAVVTYNGPGDSWTTGTNWAGGLVPATSAGPTVGTLSQRMDIPSTAIGVTLTYSASLGTLTLGTSSPAGDTRAFVVGTSVAGGSVLNITGGTVQATGTAGPTNPSIIGGNATGNSSVVNVSGGLLDLTPSSGFNGGILSVGFAGGTNAPSSSLNISGTGVVKVNQLVFNSNNAGNGGLTASVSIGSGASLSTNSIRVGTGDVAQTGTASTVTFNGGTLIATGTAGSITSNVTSVVTTGGATIQVDADVFSVNKLISGAGGLTKTGNGTLALVSQSYAGATTINAGTLRFGTSSSFTASTVIGGAGALEKAGTTTSVLTINTANTYDGPTTITSGAISLTGSGALGSTNGATTVASAASLGLGANVTIPVGETITISGPGVGVASPFAATSRGALQGVSGTSVVQGNVIINALTLTRIGVQDNALLDIRGNITEAAANTQLIFRSGGTGAVLLSGSNNWTGGTFVFGNTVRLGSNFGLPAASVLSLGTGGVGATVDLNGFNPTVAGLNLGSGGTASTVFVRNDGSTGSTLTLNPTSSQAFPGTIQDGTNTISVIKTGNFTQTFSSVSTNTYTGPTTVSGGQLTLSGSLTSPITVGAAGTLGGEGSTSQAVTFNAGSSFVFDPTTAGFFTAGGNVNTTAGATSKINLRLSTPVSTGSGIVVFQGGSLTTNGASDFNLQSRGSLSVSGNQLLFTAGVGNLAWKGANTTNPSFWDVSTTQNFSLGGVDDLFISGDNVVFDDTASSFSPNVQATLTTGTLTFNNTANAYTVSGTGVTSQGVTKSGTNRAVLNNNHTVNGSVAISAGTLQLGAGGTTGTLVATGGLSIASPGALALDFGANAGTVSLTGGITGDGAIVKNGSGRTQITTASVANTGPTTINDGTLAISFRTVAVVQTYGGPIAGNGNFEKTGSGVLTLNLANTYAGLTSVTGGVLKIANAASLASTSGVTVTPAASLALTDGIVVNKPITISGAGATVTFSGTEFATVQRGALQGGSGTSEWQGTVTLAATNTRIGIQDGAKLTVSGKITDGANDFRLLIRTGSAGALVLTNPGNDWSGGTDVLGRGVQLGVNNGLSPLSDLRIGSGGIGASVLDLNGFNQSVTSVWENNPDGNNIITNTAAGQCLLTITDGATNTYGSAISGNIAVLKTGAGTQTFTGTLTHSGNTTVTGGLINVNTPLRPVTGSLVVTGPGAATLAAPTNTSTATVAAELSGLTVTAGGTVTLVTTDRSLGAKPKVLVTSALNIAGGTLDLTNNDMLVKGGNFTAIRDAVAAWYASGTFAGTTGLISSAGGGVDGLATLAVVDNTVLGLTTFDTVTVGAGDVLVKYTYLGDTDLDGEVTTSDLTRLIKGIRSGGTLTGWSYGDSNYDGVVNGVDYANLLMAFRNQGASLGNSGLAVADVGGGAGAGTIPEPGALGLLLAGLPLVGRRRR